MSRVTANYLYSKSRRRDVHIIVEEHEKVIDGQLLSINENGGGRLCYELPQQVGVANMKSEDALILFYSEIISAYTAKEFKNVSLEQNAGRTWLIIEWTNGLGAEEKAKRLKIINDHMRKN